MNKFYKSITLTALVIVLVGMSGCQKDVDVIGLSNGIANKTMLGIYTYTSIDSAAMIVTKHELALKEKEDGSKVGYYRECKKGQGAGSDVSVDITWEATMAEDNLSMKVVAHLKNGESKTYKWQDGNITGNGEYYAKSVSGLSGIDVQNGIYDALENTAFDGMYAEYYEHLDTVPYLAWKTKVDRKAYAPEDTAQAKAKYMQNLEPYIDTIVWYLRTQVPEHTLGYVHLDTIFSEGDTTYVPVNMVYVDPTPNGSGKHLITYLVSEIKKRVEQLNDRPSLQFIGSMNFKRASEKNTAVYVLEKHRYTHEYYLDPTSAKAVKFDSICTFSADGWVIAGIANAKKFDVLLSGKEDLQIRQYEGGEGTRSEDTSKEGAFKVLSISDFDKKKGNATEGGIKYKMKK